MDPSPCHRCKVPTFGTFGSLSCCLFCLRQIRREFAARIRARSEPQYAPGVLRCDRCGAIREDGGLAPGGYEVWHELGVHGASEQRGTQAWRCNGRMRRMTLAEAEMRLAAGGDAA